LQQDAGRGWRRLNGLHGTIATGLEKQQAETPAAFLVILMTLLRLCGWGLTVDVELKPFTLNPIDVSRRNPSRCQSRRREPTHARRDDIMMIRSTCADLPFARERPAKHGGRGTLSLVLRPLYSALALRPRPIGGHAPIVATWYARRTGGAPKSRLHFADMAET